MATEVDRQYKCCTLSIPNDELSINNSLDPDLCYMFDVESSISVPTLQEPSSDLVCDEKDGARPLHQSVEAHRFSRKAEDVMSKFSKPRTDDGMRSYMCGTKWSNNDPVKPEFEVKSVHTAPVQELSMPRSAKIHTTDIREQKTADRRNSFSSTKQSSCNISVSGTTMREGKFKLHNGKLVAVTEPRNRMVRQSSASSLVSDLTTDLDDDLSVNSALTFQTWRSSLDGSTEPKTQLAKSRLGRWWRREAPKIESQRKQRIQLSASINAHEGRFKMKNGKFIPIDDSNDSKSCSIDAMAEAVRRAAKKSQRIL